MEVIKYLYKKKLEEFKKRLEELTDPRVIYVTDLVSCPLKRTYRQIFPEIAFQFTPFSLPPTLSNF